jgi:hypothetical protein
VLLQENHPIAFVSKPLGPRLRGLSTYEKEYVAILLAVEQWRHYLQLGEFIIASDQKSLSYLAEQRLHTPWQQVFTKLLGLDYQIVYKKGSDNRVADALSRRPVSSDEVQGSCLAMSSSQPKWLEEVVASYDGDELAKELLVKLSVDQHAVPDYTLLQGVLRYKGRVWVGVVPELRLKIMTAFHSSAVGGHSGAPVTYRRLKQLFAWTGMKSVVQDFVKACIVCQQAKPDRTKNPGMLQPLPVTQGAWQLISLDFVEGLPQSGQANCIMVVVDKFTKFAHFLPLKHPYTAHSVARLFLDNVYRLHGLPLSIVSDRDSVFTSTFWQALFNMADVQLRMSSAYHPQSDGQIERVNQCMETFLRSFISACPKKWLSWLPLAEFWYNTSCHSSIGRSPFEALYGYSPRIFGMSVDQSSSVGDLDNWLQDRQVMSGLIRQHLGRAAERMKSQAGKNRTEREFNIGDLVFLKLQPCIQSSLAPKANQKLAYKYFGAFPVVQRVGKVAYKLELLDSSRIHPVFHVSQLKKAVGAEITVSSALPSLDTTHQVPEKILQRRLLNRGDRIVLQVLIKWSDSPESMATWEDFEPVRQRFPGAAAWGASSTLWRGGCQVTCVGGRSEV